MIALLGLFVLFMGALAFLELLANALYGQESRKPWDPARPRPFRRPACGAWDCRVDHETLGRWVERAPR